MLNTEQFSPEVAPVSDTEFQKYIASIVANPHWHGHGPLYIHTHIHICNSLLVTSLGWIFKGLS